MILLVLGEGGSGIFLCEGHLSLLNCERSCCRLLGSVTVARVEEEHACEVHRRHPVKGVEGELGRPRDYEELYAVSA